MRRETVDQTFTTNTIVMITLEISLLLLFCVLFLSYELIHLVYFIACWVSRHTMKDVLLKFINVFKKRKKGRTDIVDEIIDDLENDTDSESDMDTNSVDEVDTEEERDLSDSSEVEEEGGGFVELEESVEPSSQVVSFSHSEEGMTEGSSGSSEAKDQKQVNEEELEGIGGSSEKDVDSTVGEKLSSNFGPGEESTKKIDNASKYESSSSYESSYEKSDCSEDDEDEEKKQFVVQRFGLNSIIYMEKYPKHSPFLLFFLRLFAFAFCMTFVVIGFYDYTEGTGLVFVGDFQYLTVCSFVLLTFYYFVSSLYSGCIYGCSRSSMCQYDIRNPYCIGSCIEYPLKLLFILSFISANVVTLMFWLLDVPTRISLGTFSIVATTFPMHGVNSLFVIVEWFLLPKISFPPCLCCLIGIYPFAYLLLVNIFVKSRFISEFPYNGLMTVESGIMPIFTTLSVAVLFVIHYFCMSCCYYCRCSAIVLQTKYQEWKERKNILDD